MAKSIPRYLQLHDDFALAAERSGSCEPNAAAVGLLSDDEANTELRQDPVPKWSAPENPGVGVALGHLRMDLGDDSKQLTALLTAVLKAGAQACDAQAAALYTLDEATTALQLRSAWGLPAARLMQPARPLEGAIADLEALLGHAVALERASSFGPWRVPEKYPAALCVPVSTESNPIGTMWFFSDRERDFTDNHTNLAEMTAGRIAAELDRAMLIASRVEATETARQIDAARRLQQSQWPQPIRLIEEGWELAGRCDSPGELGGAFYDWLWLPGDALAVMIGEASQTGIAGALTAATIRSAVRTLTEQGLSPDEALSKINRSLWFTSGGDETATLLFGIIELSSGRVRYSWAGQPSAIRTSANAAPVPLAARPPLGATTDALFTGHTLDLAATESLVLCTRMIDATGRAFNGRKIDSSAIELVESLAGPLFDGPVPGTDRALVAMKRFR